MKRIHFLPHVITAFGLATGLFVIFKTTMPLPLGGTFRLLYVSSLLLIAAGLADLFDGAIARAMHAESEFGFNFDSLADAVSFGVAPSVLTLKSLSLEPGTLLSFVAVFGALLFSIAGVLRLVRFNVKSKEAQGNPDLILSQKKHFTGLPIPAAALAMVAVNLFLNSPKGMQWIPLTLEAKVGVLSALMVVLGYFMVSRWKFPSLKALNFRVARTELVMAAVVGSVLILYGALYFFSITLAFVMWGYILLGWILSIIRLIAGKKSKTLSDFEPEEEEF